MSRKSRALPPSPFRRFNSSPEVIRLVVVMYVRFPLSLCNVVDLLFERGIDICHETVRMWWNRFGPIFAGDILRQRVSRMRGFRHWRWHLDEMYVKLNGEVVYLWRAVDHEGEILESYMTKTRDKEAALCFMQTALKRHGPPEAVTTDGFAFETFRWFKDMMVPAPKGLAETIDKAIKSDGLAVDSGGSARTQCWRFSLKKRCKTGYLLDVAGRCRTLPQCPWCPTGDKDGHSDHWRISIPR